MLSCLLFASYMRSPCPIASSLDLLGDKWTLVVVRDALLFGKTRFADFLGSGERISTNLLADRLKRLECAGILERRQYQVRPPRYEYQVTQKGRELLPVLIELVKWANRHIPDTKKPPQWMVEKFGRRAQT